MKLVHVVFAEERLEKSFLSLQYGTSEEAQLYANIQNAIISIKSNPARGIKIPKRLWPREYVKKYGVTNLWKFNLPSAWRLIYTITSDEVTILNIILDWFTHKEYEWKFNY